MADDTKKGRYDYIWRIIFILYMIVLFVFVIVKFSGSISELESRRDFWAQMREMENWDNINLTPLYTIKSQIDRLDDRIALLNIIGNILPFVPFGFILPLAWDKFRSVVYVGVVGISSVLALEGFQYVSRLGVFDVDDIILNTIGIFLGYIIVWILCLRKHR